ncbi:MAG: hypothetical protein KGQ93_12115 [Cyanobacteria bacterium REEB459]|nr:hypothetical protein [Cyanobacteria bacterium REEB459]
MALRTIAVRPLLLALLGSMLSASSLPALPPAWPVAVPVPIDPQPSGITGLTPTPAEDLGLGHLRPLLPPSGSTSLGPLGDAHWLAQVTLPVYAQPGEVAWGWLIHGWLIIAGQPPIALGRDASFAMVQADPGFYSFPVLEMRSDGWFRFRYTAAGTAWTHLKYLRGSSLALTVEPWAEQLRRSPRIQMRKPGLSQGLRTNPEESSPLRSLVSASSLIEPLQVEGNWVRVRVTEPAQGCHPLPGSTSDEGWLKWQDDQQRLLIWFGLDPACP